MFEHSSPLLLFEYFGVPSTLAPAASLSEPAQNGLLGSCSRVRSVESGRVLFRPSQDSIARISPGLKPGGYRLRSMHLHGRVLPDSLVSGLHDFYAYMFDMFAEVAGSRVPTLAPWPRDYSWALVLTHDVETSTGYRNIHLLRHLELEADCRSSWNFVPRR